MIRFILGRIAYLVPTLIGITIVAFGFVRVLPGDPVLLMAGERGMSPERYAQVSEQLPRPRPRQDARQLDATTLTTREVFQRLGKDAVVKPQVRRDSGCLCRGAIATGRDETVFSLRVFVHRNGTVVLGTVRHLILQGAHPFQYVVQATR